MTGNSTEEDEQGYEEIAFQIVNEAISNAIEQITTETKQNLVSKFCSHRQFEQ